MWHLTAIPKCTTTKLVNKNFWGSKSLFKLCRKLTAFILCHTDFEKMFLLHKNFTLHMLCGACKEFLKYLEMCNYPIIFEKRIFEKTLLSQRIDKLKTKLNKLKTYENKTRHRNLVILNHVSKCQV